MSSCGIPLCRDWRKAVNLLNKLTLNGKKERYGTVFLIALAMTFIIFLPFIITGKGYFLQYGDFNVQQYPFYMHAHDMIKSGSLGWDFKTDIGANFVGSYSFYNRKRNGRLYSFKRGRSYW